MPKDWHFDADVSDRKIKATLELLAKSFVRTHRDYLKFYEEENGRPGDIGWFQNERANVGFLAAAAWRIPGWVALQEFAMQKLRKGRSSKGRADLYIGIPRERTGYLELGIESKLAFVRSAKNVRRHLNPKNKKSALGRAMADAKNIKTPADVPIATVFLCPRLTAHERLKESLDVVADAFWTACKELKKHNLEWAAFTFAPKHASAIWLEGKAEVSYPAIGVVMVDARR